MHHLTSFNTIVEDVCSRYDDKIDYSTKIKDMESYDVFNSIKDDIVNMHDLKTGILISKDIHREFHKQYGYGDNTPSQFEDFLYKNYKIHLNDIQVDFLR